MNLKIRDSIFFIMVLSLAFNNIPKLIQLGFIVGQVGEMLEIYPLIIAFAYTFYCQYKHGNIFVDRKPFLKYICTFIGIMILSVLIGLYNYPYYDVVLNGPINQIEKLPKVLYFCQTHGINVDSKQLMQMCIVARPFKAIITEAFWCVGGAYIVYCWYKDDWKKAVDILVKGSVASLIILFTYGIIEVAYLKDNLYAKNILSTINPYIHTIVISHGWWPPLLWNGQLRLVFPEPSNVGNFIAFLLPVIWYKYFSSNEAFWNRIILANTTIMAFLVFLTKARTAYAMLFGMLILLLGLILLSRHWDLLKKYLAIGMCVAIGFGGFVGFSSMKNNKQDNIQLQENIAVQAIESNLTSLASENERSNGARYGLLKAHFRTGLQHPIFGVGRGLANAYVGNNFTVEEAKNSEIASWIRYQKERGPMTNGYSIPEAMNEFVTRFSNSGILGFIVFFFPFLYVIFILSKKLYQDKSIIAMFMMFALISSLVAGCNGNVTLFYAIWILLGVAYAVCFGKHSQKKDSHESA